MDQSTLNSDSTFSANDTVQASHDSRRGKITLVIQMMEPGQVTGIPLSYDAAVRLRDGLNDAIESYDDLRQSFEGRIYSDDRGSSLNSLEVTR